MDLDTELARLHDDVRLSALLERKFGPEEFWSAVSPLIEGAAHLQTEEIGRSTLGRPLHLLRFGSGPIRVLLWSQMHGDEPTATMALADLIRYLAERQEEERAKQWAEALTVLIVPILNPDGAARYQRRNAQGIDINRDARRMHSPELRALDQVHRRFNPDFALTLHDEDARTRVGKSERMTAMSLLATPADPSLGETPGRLRAKGLCTRMHRAIRPLVGEHVARYEVNYDPSIVGVELQKRGTATVLVETGWWPEDPELQFLRKVNFVAVVAALDAVANGACEPVSLKEYEAIPENDRDVFDVLIRGGTVVLPGAEPYRADLGLNFETPLDLENGHLANVGDLAGYSARDIFIAEGFFIHPHPEALVQGEDGAALGIGRPASLTIRKGPSPDDEPVWVIDGGVARRVDVAASDGAPSAAPFHVASRLDQRRNTTPGA